MNRNRAKRKASYNQFNRPTGRNRTAPIQTQPRDTQLAFAPEGAFATLIAPLQRAVVEQGYRQPTPIQQQAIPHLLAGRDVLGCAQTGTGKTAAFTLPILQHLGHDRKSPHPGKPRALILAPTRELAAQIEASLRTYGRYLPLRHLAIFGGVSQHAQVQKLNRGLDIVVATPGRLLDLMAQNAIKLDRVEVFVLDEADRMLDMGFIPDIRKIVAKLPAQRQTLFFSATLAPEIIELAATMVHDPVHIRIDPGKPAVERISQKVFFVDKQRKDSLLTTLLRNAALDKVIVFTKMKYAANKVARKLNDSGISATAIHGNKSQNARTQALADFKSGGVRVLVATDIAARGIDVDSISHVVNYDLPIEPEVYVHRIGRTARAGTDGDALSFCSGEERGILRSIETLIARDLDVETGHDYHSEAARNGSAGAARPAKSDAPWNNSRRAGKPARSGQNRGRQRWNNNRRKSRSTAN